MRPIIMSAWVALSLAGSSLLAGSCAGEDTAGGGRGRPANGTGGIAGGGFGNPMPVAGRLSTAGAPDFGSRPGMLPPVVPGSAPTGGSSCLDATVLFVVDGSGSMCDTFGNATRWTALRSALLAPMTGLIPQLENEAQFGIMIYDGGIDPQAASMQTNASPSPQCAAFMGGGGGGGCPRLVQVPPKFANTAMINSMFPAAQLGGSTPTHKAMNAAVDQMLASAAGKDPTTSPHYIILATDGQPNDICQGGVGGDGMMEKAAVIAAVDRAAAAGITTFVVSLAGQDMALEMHLAEVAKHGNPKDPAARTYSPATPADLVMSLRGVLSVALDCVL
jgi:hypothetical protein